MAPGEAKRVLQRKGSVLTKLRSKLLVNLKEGLYVLNLFVEVLEILLERLKLLEGSLSLSSHLCMSSQIVFQELQLAATHV